MTKLPLSTMEKNSNFTNSRFYLILNKIGHIWMWPQNCLFFPIDCRGQVAQLRVTSSDTHVYITHMFSQWKCFVPSTLTMQINFCFASVLAHSNCDSSSLVRHWEHQCCPLWMRDHQLLRLWSKGIAPDALLCSPTSNPLRLHLHSGKITSVFIWVK